MSLMKHLYSRLALITSFTLVMGYFIVSAAWTSMGTVNTGDQMSATIWNNLVGNVNDLNSRTTSTSSIWPSVSGGIAYTGGNVGIGTASPGAPLTIFSNGGSNIGSINIQQNSTPNGSTSKGAHIFFGDIGNSNRGWIGFFDSVNHGNGTQLNIKSAGTIGFTSGGTGNGNQVTIDTTGNVGIGTTSPITKLDVGGISGASINLSGGGVFSPPSGLGYGLFPHAGVGLGLYSTNGGISFWGGLIPSEYMRIVSGNVGIGTTSPLSGFKLDTNGSIRGIHITAGNVANSSSFGGDAAPTGITNSLEVRTLQGEGYPGIDFHHENILTSYLSVQDGTYRQFRMESSPSEPITGLYIQGNVGIGTTNPVYKFNVYATGDAVIGGIDGGINNTATFYFHTNEATLYNTRIGSNSGALVAYTSNAERMRVDTSGNVGIGTTSPVRKFVISNGGVEGIEFQPIPSIGNANLISYNRGTSNWSDFKLSASNIIFGYGSTETNEAMRITSAGNIGIGTATPQGKIDIQSGYNRKIFKTIALSQTDYHPFYFKLFPIPAATNDNSTIISGKLSAERVNDIGVSTEIDFHVSRSYHGGMYASYEVTKGDISPDLRVLNIGGVDWLVFRFISAPTWLSMTFDGTFYSTDLTPDDTYLTAVELSSDTSTVASGVTYQNLKFNPQGGNVGIGTTGPAYKLDVSGDIRATGTIYGAVKNFNIEDPRYSDPNKRLTHSVLEGPEIAVFYRGESTLKSGETTVKLPTYFESLTHQEGRTVLLTAIDGFDGLAVRTQGGQQVKDGKFIVYSNNVNSTQRFNWEVKAVRSDVAPLVAESEMRDGKEYSTDGKLVDRTSKLAKDFTSKTKVETPVMKPTIQTTASGSVDSTGNTLDTTPIIHKNIIAAPESLPTPVLSPTNQSTPVIIASQSHVFSWVVGILVILLGVGGLVLIPKRK